jgi:DNA invertase Pin-like site-specific DNA recombinase
MSQPPDSRPLRLVGLLRVSTAGQLDGYGLPAQERDIRAWAKATPGVRLVKVLKDGTEAAGAVSGQADDDEREGLAEALGMVAAGEVDGILAPNLDRLARALTQQEAILAVVWAYGGRVFTADHGEHLQDDDEDPMRTAMRQMRGVFIQLERGMIVKRLKNGRRTKASLGRFAYGAPAYGTTSVDKELVDKPGEAEHLAAMRAWKAEGAGIREITRRLNDAGVPAKRGGKWHPTAVARLLDEDARRADQERSRKAAARRREAKRRTRAEKVLDRVG